MKRKTHKVLLVVAAMIVALSGWAMPIEDITLKNVSPKAGELDTELRSLENITLTFSASELKVGDNAKATLACPDGNTLTASMVVNKFLSNTILLEFPDILPYNGEYTLTIKKWSIGDEEWVENPETGHTNSKIEIKWSISDGMEPGVDYSIAPLSVTPANNVSFDYNNNGQQLTQIKIVYPAGIYVNPNIPVNISNTEARFNQHLLFVAQDGAEKCTFTAMVSPAPLITGNYTLTIPAGAFGDDEYLEGKGGRACKPYSCVYSITGPQTEEGDLLDDIPTYTMTPQDMTISCNGNEFSLTLEWSSLPEIYEASLENCKLLDNRHFQLPFSSLRLATDPMDNSTSISFNAELDQNASYTFVVPQGMFGTEMWKDSNQTKGSTNPQFAMSFTPSQINVGIEHIICSTTDNQGVVYNIQGMKISENASKSLINFLPKGIYIICGKKVLIQ